MCCVAGAVVVLGGQLTGRYLYETGSPPVYDEQSGGVADQPVVLQPRTSSTAACIVVGTKRCQWQLHGRGEEPWLPRSATTFAAPGSTTIGAPITMSGQQPNAYLWVDPGGTQNAALQFKNASGVWQGLMYKTCTPDVG